MNKTTKWLLLVLDAVLVLALVVGVYLYQQKTRNADENAVDAEELDRRYTRIISYQGEDFPLKRRVSSVLLIGTDNYIDDKKQSRADAFYNYNLADFLILLVFDHADRTVTPVQICRDTMCDVPWIASNGGVGGTTFEQITYAHTYGSGKQDSCANTVAAVRSLLFDLPIDNYFAFTMDAVPILNDMVGGVTVKLEDDVPALGPEYVKGAEITLRGQASLRFVRYRDVELLDSNLTRMGRHRLYLEAFTAAARGSLAEDEDFAVRAFKALEPFLCTDMTADDVSQMVEQLRNYRLMPTVTPSGEYVMGDRYAEYYMDETALWESVRSTFCH